MKQIFFFSLLLVTSLSLFARDVEFNNAPNDVRRIVPNSADEIYSFYDSIKAPRKSVVNISTNKGVSSNQEIISNDPFFNEFFKGFFGKNRTPKKRKQHSLGSGVIISKDGYIITNNHVVKNADEIMVTLPKNKKEYKAKLIGGDEGSDLAVIKIEATGLNPIALGDSSNLKEGDIVFAIGNPFGVGETITQGIVSALNKNRMGINRYENFIQTDASINPGNSGGALVDSRGALIGINSAILSRSGGNNGVGFAIPVNMVRNIAKKLITDGKVVRGYMGVSIGDMNKDFSSLYIKQYGALVLNIQKDSSADRYGLKRGDLVYEVNGKSVKNGIDLQTIIGSLNPKDKITLKLERNKKNITIKMTLGTKIGDVHISKADEVLGGLYLSNINKQNRHKYRLRSDVNGVLITNVEPKSKAEIAGFQAGDIIIAIEERDIESIEDVENILKKYSKKVKRIYINRYGGIYLVVMK